MKITNHQNLPAPFVRMAESEYQYKPKRYSATELLKPVREILLKRRHNNELEQDCSDMVWLLFGQAVHHILESNGTGDTEFTEERLTYTLENGYTISGIIDFYDMAKGEVVDYKTASVWKVIHGDYEDWDLQGLTYAWLLWKNNLPVKTVKFYAILKDHSKRDAKYKADYPKQPVVPVEFPVNEARLQVIDKFLRDKIDELIRYEGTPDDKLPVCTPEERWNDGDKYAVMKKGRKTALRVLDSLETAEKYKTENSGDYIEKRPGTDKKCLEYCLCCEKCSYWQSLQKDETTSE